MIMNMRKTYQQSPRDLESSHRDADSWERWRSRCAPRLARNIFSATCCLQVVGSKICARGYKQEHGVVVVGCGVEYESR